MLESRITTEDGFVRTKVTLTNKEKYKIQEANLPHDVVSKHTLYTVEGYEGKYFSQEHEDMFQVYIMTERFPIQTKNTEYI